MLILFFQTLKVSRKSEWWSFKLNRPGSRFMVLMDARRRVRMVWGGYSPKLYDGHFVEMKKEWFLSNCPNDVFITDNHFSWARDNRDQFPKTYANYPEPAEKSVPDDMHGVTVLTAEKKRYNRAVAHCRARVESPFGTIKTLWKVLQKPFMETKEQLDCVFYLALAVHNTKL